MVAQQRSQDGDSSSQSSDDSFDIRGKIGKDGLTCINSCAQHCSFEVFSVIHSRRGRSWPSKEIQHGHSTGEVGKAEKGPEFDTSGQSK